MRGPWQGASVLQLLCPVWVYQYRLQQLLPPLSEAWLEEEGGTTSGME